ncbi:leucyl aminopeptidase [Prosthecochloris sp. ZM]|nr:leucyl aminopeptidase [Prosthecochloris sp. ZM]
MMMIAMKTETTVTKSSLKNIKAGLLVLPFSVKSLKKDAPKVLGALGLNDRALKDFKAAAGDTLLFYPGGAGVKASRVLLLGIGEGAATEDYRKAGTSVARQAATYEVQSVAVDASSIVEWSARSALSLEDIAELLTGSILNATYRFDRLKSGKMEKDKKKKKASYEGISRLIFRVNAGSINDVEKGTVSGMVIAESQGVARDLVNLPGNLLNAVDIARYASESAEKHGYTATVFDKDAIDHLGMGGLMAVNKGSKEPPTFTILDYNPGEKSKGTVALVGKGVTFDSGGISIKPANGMDEMKCDMAGAAVVIATVEAAARLGLEYRILGFIPSTDNMPGGAAQKPGDVITTYSGITVEVGNTDAEGRLILADALSYAIETYKPDTIIDLATLTGACIVALGYGVAGMFSNDDNLAAALYDAGQVSGEKVWRLPLWDEYDELIKSEVADVHNTGGRGAGTITAAKFLQNFIGDHKHWAHIDIAGPAFSGKAGAKAHGGTGFGVSLLLDFLRNM